MDGVRRSAENAEKSAISTEGQLVEGAGRSSTRTAEGTASLVRAFRSPAPTPTSPSDASTDSFHEGPAAVLKTHEPEERTLETVKNHSCNIRTQLGLSKWCRRLFQSESGSENGVAVSKEVKHLVDLLIPKNRVRPGLSQEDAGWKGSSRKEDKQVRSASPVHNRRRATESIRFRTIQRSNYAARSLLRASLTFGLRRLIQSWRRALEIEVQHQGAIRHLHVKIGKRRVCKPRSELPMEGEKDVMKLCVRTMGNQMRFPLVTSERP